METFKTPVDNYKITSKYSPSRLHPKLNVYRMHAGIDLINTKIAKAPIYATAAGKVRLVKTTKDGYGKYIIITHDVDNVKYESVYAHLDSFLVVQGDLVKQGDRIAYMGNTGIGTGIHLHFELHKGTYDYGGGTYPTSFDPEPYVTGKKDLEKKVVQGMKVSKAGLDLIKKYEGFYENAYLCPANVWTIGYGTTKWSDGKSVKKGDKITKQQAETLLEKQVYEHAANTFKYIKVSLTQSQFDALASFQYNLGSAILGKDTSIANYINKGDLNNSARVMRLYNKANGKVLAGLEKRRTEEAAMLLSGVKKETGDDEVMKFSNETTKSAVREFIRQSVEKGYFGKQWLESFDKGTLLQGDYEGLLIIAQNKKK